MIKKLYVTIYIVIVIAFLGWGNKLIPSRHEISKLQLSKVAGFDVTPDDKVDFSLVIDDTNGKPSDSSSENGGSNKKKEELITINADTFVMCFRALQSYREKLVTTGHIKHILIGTEAAERGLIEEIDFASRNYDLRFDTNIYLTKDISSKDFLLTGIEERAAISERIENLSTSWHGVTNEGNFQLVDMLKLLTSEDKSGLVPALQIVDENTNVQDWQISTTEGESEQRIETGGYGIIKNAKLIGFLNRNEMLGYNIAKKNFKGVTLDIFHNNEKLGVNISNSKTKTEFSFSGDNLDSITLTLKLNVDLSEISSGKNIFKKNLAEYENEISNLVRDYISMAIEKSKSSEVDFFEFEQLLKINHPYRYRKLKDGLKEALKQVPIIINVETKLNRTYGMLSIIEE